MFSRFWRWITRQPQHSIVQPLPKITPIAKGDRPNPNQAGAKLLWYPLASTAGAPMKTRGTYQYGYPQGAIVHFTAGHCDTEQHAKNTADGTSSSGYCFFVIGPTGQVYQRFPLNKWGWHAGKSYWPGLGTNIADKVVGIEVACAGDVSASGKSWFGKVYDKSRLRVIKEKKDNIQPGTYVKYTPEQEEALIELLLWLKRNNPGVFNLDYVLGHDSISPGRKVDPGGSLSMSIPELQKLLKVEYAKRSA